MAHICMMKNNKNLPACNVKIVIVKLLVFPRKSEVIVQEYSVYGTRDSTKAVWSPTVGNNL